MNECQYLTACEFVLRYVERVKPHWDEFVSQYCQGDLQELCKRLQYYRCHGTAPPAALMPTGRTVPGLIEP